MMKKQLQSRPGWRTHFRKKKPTVLLIQINTLFQKPAGAGIEEQSQVKKTPYGKR
jgi:hypothetical protein